MTDQTSKQIHRNVRYLFIAGRVAEHCLEQLCNRGRCSMAGIGVFGAEQDQRSVHRVRNEIDIIDKPLSCKLLH